MHYDADAARHLGQGQQLHGHLEDHGEHAFAADHRREQVEPRRVERIAAELDRLATRLQQGGDIDYDASELAAMTASLSAADATTPREMILGTAKWLVPVVALLAIVLFVARSGGGMHV